MDRVKGGESIIKAEIQREKESELRWGYKNLFTYSQKYGGNKVENYFKWLLVEIYYLWSCG